MICYMQINIDSFHCFYLELNISIPLTARAMSTGLNRLMVHRSTIES